VSVNCYGNEREKLTPPKRGNLRGAYDFLYRPFPIGGKLVNLYKDPSPPVSKGAENDDNYSDSESERMMKTGKVWSKAKEGLLSNLS